jgi:hypothetical protein
MWITRSRYEQLVLAEAESRALRAELQRTLKALDRAEERADAAVDAALVSRAVAPITPQKPQLPELPMFDDQPEELRELMKQIKRDPLGTLLTEGKGDHDAG